MKRMGEAGGERLGQGGAVTWLALKAWLTDLNSAITWHRTPNVTLPGGATLLVIRVTPSFGSPL